MTKGCPIQQPLSHFGKIIGHLVDAKNVDMHFVWNQASGLEVVKDPDSVRMTFAKDSSFFECLTLGRLSRLLAEFDSTLRNSQLALPRPVISRTSVLSPSCRQQSAAACCCRSSVP